MLSEVAVMSESNLRSSKKRSRGKVASHKWQREEKGHGGVLTEFL